MMIHKKNHHDEHLQTTPAVSMERTMKRAALGRVKELGTLFHRQTEEFVSGSIFKDPAALQFMSNAQKPDGDWNNGNVLDQRHGSDILIVQRPASHFDYKFITSSMTSLQEEESATPALDVMLEAPPITSKQASVSMVFHTRTVQSEFAVHHAKVMGVIIDTDALMHLLENNSATHFVSEIVFGADVVISFSQECSSYEEAQEVQGRLAANVQAFGAKISGDDASVDIKEEEEDNESFENLNISVVGNIQFGSTITLKNLDDVMTLIRDLPQTLAVNRYGKVIGVPMQYTLTPLKALFSSVDYAVKEINTQIVERIQTYRDEAIAAKLKLDDLCNRLNILQPIVGNDELESINNYQAEVAMAITTELPGKIKNALQSKDPPTAASDLLESLAAESTSPDRVNARVRKEEDNFKVVLFAYKEPLQMISEQSLLPKSKAILSFAPRGVPKNLLGIDSDSTYILFLSINMLESSSDHAFVWSQKWREFKTMIEEEKQKGTLAREVSFKIFTENDEQHLLPAIERFDQGRGAWADVSKAIMKLEDRFKQLEQVRFQCGRVDVAVSGPAESSQFWSGKGSRSKETTVRFPQTFASAPKVMVAISCLDVSNDNNTRIRAKATNVTLNEFTLEVQTWSSSGIWRVEVEWVATNFPGGEKEFMSSRLP